MTKPTNSPNWRLILCLYAIAALFLVIVRDELGTDNDPQLKAGGWIALTFAVYWSVRGLIVLVATTAQVKKEE